MSTRTANLLASAILAFAVSFIVGVLDAPMWASVGFGTLAYLCLVNSGD